MSRQLEGKVALITGAASGIGLAVARRFLAEGASVVCVDRQASERAAALEIDGDGRIAWVQADVRSAADNQRAVDTALERFGRLDVFVGNAGIYDNRRPLRDYTAAELDAAFTELFDVDVRGYLSGALAALPALTASRGCILFTSSVSGSHAGFGGPLYVAAKHAVNGLVKQLAFELAPDVRVNAVAPGYVPTGLAGPQAFSAPGAASAAASHGSAPMAADLPLGAIGLPDDYAGAYVYLASDACSRTATGTILALDGGAGVRGPRR